MTNRQFWIAKSNLRETKWVDVEDQPLADGAARLRVDAFALTANNVTYAAFGGEPMHYWQFFPSGDDGWGRVPVWGFATVTESRIEGVPVGKRLWGYYPASDTLDVTPVRVDTSGFMDGAAHRQGLAPIYNTYYFTDTDPAYDAGYEPQQMLFRPLYATGWWLADTLTEGAHAPLAYVAMSSASSKTALALAHALQSNDGPKTIGITSSRNKPFVEASGLYDQTVTYDEIGTLDASASPGGYVDFMGSPETNARIHSALGDGLKRSLIVGATEWDTDRTPRALPGPTPEFFFVPDVAAARIKAVGPSLMQTMGEDLRAFYPASGKFVTPKEASGPDAITKTWINAVDGAIAADEGYVLSL